MKTALAGIVLGLASVAALAWPTKTVTLIVPFPPGGSTDMIARTISAKLGEKIAREWEDLDIDVVIPIPETSCDIALEIARILDGKADTLKVNYHYAKEKIKEYILNN